MSDNRTLECPACAAPMKVINRAGIHLDRCPACKGVYLDNGELEKLIAAMSAADDDDEKDWLRTAQPHASHPQPSHPQAHHQQPHYGHHAPDAGYRPEYHQRGYHKKPKSAMKTFMDIFD